MALTFPSSPSNGQIYADTTTGNRYIYNATAGVWSFAANNVGMSVSSTPPSNVAPGAMWFNREIGRTFVYYDDGDSKQWIETVPAGAVDTNVVAGYVNPVFASINSAYTTANSGFAKANVALTGVVPVANGGTGLSSLTAGYVPYGSGTSAFQVSPIWTNGSNIGIGSVDAKSLLYLGAGNESIGNSTYTGQLTLNAYSPNLTSSGIGVEYKVRADSNGYGWRTLAYHTGSTTDYVFQTRQGSASWSEAMRIDGSGNVGIGTNGPVNRLDIQQLASVPGYPVRVLYNSPSVTYANSHIVVQNMNGANGDKALYGAALQATGGNGYNPVAFGAIQTDYLNRYAAYVVYVSSSDNYSAASHERMRIDNAGRVTMPYQPCFHATSGSTATSAGNVIIFNTIVTNIGSNYNSSTGRFTAPIAGTYLFIATYLKDAGNADTYCAIRKNASAYANMDATGSIYSPSAMQAILTLAAGDYVDVYVNGGTVYVSYRQFSGYLIG